MEVNIIPCLEDNYSYILVDKKNKSACVIDPSESTPIINFIENIFKLAKKFVFIVIACYLANKKLPDGRNVHLSIKNPKEWKKIISKFKVKYPNISPYVICATNRDGFGNGFTAVS